MPQSFTKLHYHLIFSTKHRLPTIRPEWQQRLYDYIGGIVCSEHGVLLAAGGIVDHVHLLVQLGQNRSLADVLRVVKTNSSKWVHEVFPDVTDFGWQRGYGAFTVSYSGLEAVRHYLSIQQEHHRA